MFGPELHLWTTDTTTLDCRATELNAAVWSKFTSSRGHWLHKIGELTLDLAAVGYAVVDVHHRQLRRLDRDLATVLFGAALG